MTPQPDKSEFVITEVSSHKQRALLTAMVTNDRFLREVAALYKPEFFEEAFRTIAGWCLAYGAQYGRAPRAEIQRLFEESVSSGEIKESQARGVAEALDWMSSEMAAGDTVNVDYLLDMAQRHFEHVNLDITAAEIKHHLGRGDIEAAREAITAHKTVERPRAVGINPVTDIATVIAAFQDAPAPLFTFPGPLGELLNDSLVRDFLLGIMGPEKRGKTFLLIELAFRALMARLNVAFFELGDLSQNQLLRRVFVRLACRSDRAKYTGDIPVPVVDCMWHQQGLCENMNRPRTRAIRDAAGDLLKGEGTDWGAHTPCPVCPASKLPFPGVPAYKVKHVDRPLGPEDIETLAARLGRRLGKHQFKVACYPTDTFSVRDMDRTLDYWEEYEGFVPDIILADYADIMAAPDPRKEERGQINDTWMGLRRVSQERHALVIVPTQSNAGSYSVDSLSLANFANDKRKYAHVNGMLAMNRTPEEKDQGLLRLGWLLLREDDFSIDRQVVCLQSLKTGQPIVGSYWNFRGERECPGRAAETKEA